MKVFIAGATEVVGRRLVPLLLRDGHQITAVARAADKAAGLRAVGAQAIEQDLFNRETLPKAVSVFSNWHRRPVSCSVSSHPPKNGDFSASYYRTALGRMDN